MSLKLKELNRRRGLTDQIVDMLRAEIITGRLPPDAQVSDIELARRFDVSRTPIRQAVLRLADEGLVTIYPQFGSFVAPISLELVIEAQFIREHLECALIRQAAQRIDDTALAELRRLVDQQHHAASRQDIGQFYALDEAMHEMFAVVAGFPGVWKFIQQKKVHLDRVRHQSYAMADHLPHLVDQHEAITYALAEHDAVRAESVLRMHLREVFAVIDKMTTDTPPTSGTPRRRNNRRASA